MARACRSVARQDHQEAPRDQWQRVTDVFDAMGLGARQRRRRPGRRRRLVHHAAGASRRYRRTCLRGRRESDQPAGAARGAAEGTDQHRDRARRRERSEAARRVSSMRCSWSTRTTSSPSIAAVLGKGQRSAQARRPAGVDRTDAAQTQKTRTRAAQTRASLRSRSQFVEARRWRQAGFEIVRKDPAFVTRPRSPGAEGSDGQAPIGLAAGGPPASRYPTFRTVRM